MGPTSGIPLPLRNALASLALRALRSDEARTTLDWILQDGEVPPPPQVALTLVDVGLADPPGAQLLDLYVPFMSHIRAHAARAFVATRTLDAGPSPTDSLGSALLGAAALWEHGLYFEVHEILEPEWARSSGDRREALQGLIQIAVAFHHWVHGNTRGARTLLSDGRAKLGRSGHTLPGVDASALLLDTAPWADDLAARADPSARAVPTLRVR